MLMSPVNHMELDHALIVLQLNLQAFLTLHIFLLEFQHSTYIQSYFSDIIASYQFRVNNENMYKVNLVHSLYLCVAFDVRSFLKASGIILSRNFLQ